MGKIVGGRPGQDQAATLTDDEAALVAGCLAAAAHVMDNPKSRDKIKRLEQRLRSVVGDFFADADCGEFAVPTPVPYKPYSSSPETRRRLLDEAQALWHVLEALGISAADAAAKRYSLNAATYEALYREAASRGRYDVTQFLKTHGWERDCERVAMFQSKLADGQEE